MSSNSQSSLLPLDPIMLPSPPSWLPLTWAWWVSIAAGIMTLLAIWGFIRWKKKRLAPKKAALRILKQGSTPSSAIELVRQSALCYFPREEIAQLTGKEWYLFLDEQLSTPLFADNYDKWQHALYSKQHNDESQALIEHCAHWIEHALPPKKRRKSRGPVRG